MLASAIATRTIPILIAGMIFAGKSLDTDSPIPSVDSPSAITGK